MAADFKIIKPISNNDLFYQHKNIELNFNPPDFNKCENLNFSILINKLMINDPTNLFLYRIYSDFTKESFVFVDKNDLYSLQCQLMLISPSDLPSEKHFFEIAQRYYKYFEQLINTSTLKEEKSKTYFFKTTQKFKNFYRNLINKFH